MPDRLPGRKLHGSRITEAAHTPHGAEVVIEGTVLLHQEDDVLDVLDGSGSIVGRDGQDSSEVQRYGRGERRGSHEFEKCATVFCVHDHLVDARPREP